jgi:hypothetical protein
MGMTVGFSGRRQGLGVTLLLIAGVLWGDPGVAWSDMEPCQDVPDVVGIGRFWDHPTIQPRGALARIEARFPLTCTNQSGAANGNSWSYSWILVGNFDPGDLFDGGRAQIGLFKNGASGGCGCLRFGWEFGITAGEVIRGIWGSPSVDTLYEFRVVEASGPSCPATNHCLRMVGPDGQTPPPNGSGKEPATDFDHDAVWANQTIESGADVLFPQSDVGGDAAEKQDLVNLRRRQADGDWVLVNFDDGYWTSANTIGCWAHQRRPGGSTDDFQVWTDPIDHQC